MKMPKVDNSGVEAATRAQAQAQEAATNLQKNFQADLGTENMAQVVAGGSAAAESDLTTGTLKRRRGGGLSSQLGIMQ